MGCYLDIYQLGNNRIHVVLRGEAVGTATFGNREVFTGFLKACQEFIEHNPQEADATDRDGETRHPIPEAFLDAFGE